MRPCGDSGVVIRYNCDYSYLIVPFHNRNVRPLIRMGSPRHKSGYDVVGFPARRCTIDASKVEIQTWMVTNDIHKRDHLSSFPFLFPVFPTPIFPQSSNMRISSIGVLGLVAQASGYTYQPYYANLTWEAPRTLSNWSNLTVETQTGTFIGMLNDTYPDVRQFLRVPFAKVSNV